MRILYSSNGFWSSSGYGGQGASLVPRLNALDEVEDIAMFAWFGLKGGVQEIGGIRVYPGLMDPYGNDILAHHVYDFQADVVITLIDIWVMKETRKDLPEFSEWWPWFPSDTQPVSPFILKAVEGADVPLVYSQFTQKQLAEQGVDSLYIPHGLEKDVFKILEPEKGAKETLFGVDESHFVVAMVAANKGIDDRKAFAYQIGAFAKFAQDKPNVRLYIHTDPSPRFNGIDLNAMVKGFAIEDKVVWPHNYKYLMGYPPAWMARMYNTADVYLGASKGEGFGIPLIEAQACGTPVITSEFTSMPELVRWGARIPPITLEYSPGLQAWRCIPNSTLICNALEEYYAAWLDNGGSLDQDQAAKTSCDIHKEFDWDVVVKDYWHPLIKERENASS